MDIRIIQARDELLEHTRDYLPPASVVKITKALDFAIMAHDKQTRLSGEPYVLHPISVAKIVTDIKLDTMSIVSALLHDVVEDTHYTIDDIKQLFGKKEAQIIAALTRFEQIEHATGEKIVVSRQTISEEKFYKLLLALSKDVRVLLVKIADRLHNIRTLSHIPDPEKRRRIALETMELYVPLAERVGLHIFKNELQDLTFAELYPAVRQSIINRLDFFKKSGELHVIQVISAFKKLMDDHAITAIVSGREKTAFSIWKKMETKKVSFEQLSDLFAFRIITNTIPDCYKVLGILHTKYHVIPNGFQDFISTPKINGYSSLHTVLIGEGNKPIEIQIRTKEMHEIAERGIAAHWAYKQGIAVHTKAHKWIMKISSMLQDKGDVNKSLIVKDTKLEMGYAQIFCFTPKGDLIPLQKNATALDFACAIHSSLGLHCGAVKINGRLLPVETSLSNGDQVEVIRSEAPHIHNNWESIVKTGKARNIFRRFIKNKERDEFLILGKSILDNFLKRLNITIEDKKVDDARRFFKKKTMEDFVFSVGNGTTKISDILYVLYPEKKGLLGKFAKLQQIFSGKKRSAESTMQKAKPFVIDTKNMIQGVAIHVAACCHPFPGEKVMGIMIPNKGIEVHNKNCPKIQSMTQQGEQDKLMSLEWGGENQVYAKSLKITLLNKIGSLSEVTVVLAENKVNILDLSIIKRSNEFYEIVFVVTTQNQEQFNHVVNVLKLIDKVCTVEIQQ